MGSRMAYNLKHGPYRRPDGERMPPPGDEELPPPRARVPRKPRPSGGANHLKLVPPRPPEPDPDAPGV